MHQQIQEDPAVANTSVLTLKMSKFGNSADFGWSGEKDRSNIVSICIYISARISSQHSTNLHHVCKTQINFQTG